jgi:hypothetical protein
MSLIENFLNNLIAGVIASILTWVFVRYSRQMRQRRRFADYTGLYETFLNDERIADEIIELSWVGENLLFAQSNSADGSWESYITMDEVVPNVGSGFFQYKSRTDYGVHQIQRNLEKDTIFVFAHNPALGSPPVAYIWKKVHR